MASEAGLPESIHPEQRLKFKQVSLLVGKGRTAIYAEIKSGRFPPPERDGIRCSRWRAGDVLAHLASKRGAA